MGVKVTGCCCFQPLLAHHPSSSFSSKTRWTNGGEDGSLTVHMPANKLPPNRCFKFSNKRSTRKSLSRAIISLHRFTDDDDNEAEDELFIRRRLQELSVRIQDDGSRGPFRTHPDSKNLEDSMNPHHRQVKDSDISSFRNALQPLWPAVHPVPTPNWKEPDGILPASVEIKANSVDLPLSLRILKHKKKKKNMKKNKMQEAGKSAVRKAFSSMVFMVRELQSYSLQTWEVLSYTNLKVILARVQDEMNASFVWLFQHIFSSTPTLMLYLMLLLANFTAYSISDNFPATAAVSQVEVQETHQQQQRFDTCATKSFSVGRTAAVGGGGGGGGKVRPVAGATDDGQSGSSCHISRSIVSGEELGEEEDDDDIVWKRVVEEASRMQASLRDEALMDRDTLRMLVAPVSVEVEGDGEYWEYKQRELMYSQAILQDPENVLILANFAQFLFIVLHDHDRAEYYFKRAVKASNPADAEALSQYANFLWLARNDLGAAEETYLEAIAADPGNPNPAANYAHFLWNTGGQDTCYPPLDDSNDTC